MKNLLLRVLLLWVAALLANSLVYADSLGTGDSFAAVIDAGSSGSRIYLYKTQRTNARVKVDDLFAAEPHDVPGLSDFKDRPLEAYAEGVAPLLVSLRSFLADKGLHETDITLHVLATGGLRLLESQQSEAILSAVSAGLKTTTFKVGQVEILPSEIEGLLAWADLNSLMGRLERGKETLGIVEVGGASAQLAYEVKGQTVAAAKTWHLQGQTYRVVSKSFLGLGQNAARKSMIHSQGGGLVENPCYPEGISVADKKTGAEGLSGAFDFSRCTNLYREVIRHNPDFDRSLLRGAAHRSFAGIGEGNPVGPIKGSISLWKLNGTNPHDSLKVIQAACKRPWSSFKDTFGGDLVNQNQCANSIFIETLLYDSAGLDLGTHQLQHMALAGGRVPSWTRGFLLLKDGLTH